MRISLFFCAAALVLLQSSAVADPPKLVSTSPPFWATNVNPSTNTLSLTFDQSMRTRFSDWFGKDVLSPDSSLKTTFSADHLSCSVDVHLNPGRVYICGLNERGIPGVGFQNEKGLTLRPTYLVFQTAGSAAPNDAPPHVKGIFPAHGAEQVDSMRVRSIVISFDQPMNTLQHGLHLFENGTPIDISRVPFAYSPDGRTFTLPYNLKPKTQYRLELNSIYDIGFSRATRVPLWPVRITFTTA